jgi:sulfur-carrier protein
MSPGRILTLRYFAWVREKVGRTEERVSVPPEIGTVGELMAWLKQRGPEYALAFERESVIRTAIDQRHVKPQARLDEAREVAFFPPVTGG